MSLLLDALHKARQEQANQGSQNEAAANAAADCVDEHAPSIGSDGGSPELSLDIETEEASADKTTPAVDESSDGNLQALAEDTRTTDAYIERVEEQLAQADAVVQADSEAQADPALTLADSPTTGLKPANIAAAEPQVSQSILNDFENDDQQRRKRNLLLGSGVSVVVLLLLVMVVDWGQLFGGSASNYAQPLPNINLDDEPLVDSAEPIAEVTAPVAASPATDSQANTATGTAAATPVSASKPATPLAADARATIANGIEPVNEPVAAAAESTPAEQTIRISKRRSSTRLQTALSEAYQLYSAGRLDEASAAYAAIERSHPANTDALNGLGATALARGEQRLAQRYFYDALATDPNNVYARAALLSTLQKMSPGDREVELKQVISQNPDNAFANFALGSFYAEQQNWHAAQQAFFEAHRAEPVTAEYSYNLAVALDHLDKPAAALTYYQRTLSLSTPGESTLPLAAVEARVASLSAAATQNN